MDRKEFKNFIEYFGADEEQLCFRLRHEKLSSEECWRKFGFNNAVNLVIKKRQLKEQIVNREKIRLVQEGTKDRWFDLEDLNNKGYAIYILPNLAHRKSDIHKVYAHTWDYDCGKEVYDVQTREEAEKIEFALKKRPDIDPNTVNIHPLKRKKSPFSVRAYRTVNEINRLKKQFLEKYRKDLEQCLINESPNGFRGFYIYETVQEYNESEYEAIQKGIIQKFGTDTAFKQGAQPARVSGFYHNKRIPSMVTTIQFPSSFVTKEQMKEMFLSNEPQFFHNQLNPQETPRNSQKTPAKIQKNIEFKEEMIFIDAIDYIKQQEITEIFPDFSYTENFSCVLHNDKNPSARLGIYNGHHLYGCFGCEKSISLIDLYIEIKKDGDRTKFREAVEELAAKFGIKIVESEFYIKEATKYQRNQKWIVEMFDDGEMETKYPTLCRKFFSKVVRYKKINQIEKKDGDGSIRMVGGDLVLDRNGKPIKNVYRSRREMVLRHLTFYANARLREINVDENSIFWISFFHIAELMLSEDAEIKDIVKEKKKIFYLVKELELLGFIKQIETDKIPKTILKKAKQLSYVVHPSGKKYKKELISFYSMNDFFEMETIINQKAIELAGSGYKNTVHRGKNAMIIHQGEEVANQLFRDDRKIDNYYIRVKKKLFSLIKKEIKNKGYFFKRDITKPKLKLMINYETKFVTTKEKEKVIDIFLYGKNGIIKEFDLKELKLTKVLANKIGLDQKTYEGHKLQFIYIKRG